jgi:hypothetical protein
MKQVNEQCYFLHKENRTLYKFMYWLPSSNGNKTAVLKDINTKKTTSTSSDNLNKHFIKFTNLKDAELAQVLYVEN